MTTAAPQSSIRARTVAQGAINTVEFGLPGPTPGEVTSPAFPGIGEPAEALVTWGSAAGSFAARASRSSGCPIALDLTDVGLTRSALGPLLAGLLRGAGTHDLGAVIAIALPPELCGETFEGTLSTERACWRARELAIELTNARGGQLTPELFAHRAREAASAAGLGIRVTEAGRLAREGFGGITAIGRGSAQPPVLVELWYAGPDGPGDAPPPNAVALAGKGVTFDSGGLSLKPPSAMYSMHTDCAGAAVVLAALTELRDLGAEVPVYAALPLVENLPGPSAVRPGDVVTTRSGIGLEIVDTDFEGRVVLADAIALLAEAEPRAIVSLATLTYQISVALGPEIAGLFARDAQLGKRLDRAAGDAGEALWQMPWATRYAPQLRSNAPGAELRNHPLSDTGRAITAALFLGEFAPRETPFAHIDFAGPAVRSTPDGPAATGYGVRTLLEFLLSWR